MTLDEKTKYEDDVARLTTLLITCAETNGFEPRIFMSSLLNAFFGICYDSNVPIKEVRKVLDKLCSSYERREGFDFKL